MSTVDDIYRRYGNKLTGIDIIKEQKRILAEQKEIIKQQGKIAHEKALKQSAALTSEYKKHASTAIITAFGLVIALVWKDFVTAIMPSITTPNMLENFPVLASLWTAVIVTSVAVFGIWLVSNWMKSPRKKRKNRK